MKPLQEFFSYKTIYKDNNSYLVLSLKKKEEINYTQVQLLENNLYKKYFLPFRCTKSANINKISYDISNLTSLEEYLKIEMKQDEYFGIISDIQKILSFCKEAGLSFDNLICTPAYMYYDAIAKKVMMAYVPVRNSHYLCYNILKCLSKISKSAKNIIITNGNMMNAYDEYLIRETQQGQKTNDFFSADSLLHFFNNHRIEGDIAKTDKNIEADNRVNPVEVRYSIKEQIKEAPVHKNIQPASGTVIRRSEPVSAPVSEQATLTASLTDSCGRKTPIFYSPFKIGRNADNDLALVSFATVSGSHADIIQENGEYILKDHSANGTYVQAEGTNEKVPVKVYKLKNRDAVYFDNVCYIFEVKKSGSGTVIVSKKENNEKPVAYIEKISDRSRLKIFSYPFSSNDISGLVFFEKNSNNTKSILVKNFSSPSFSIEGENIAADEEREIFSGCSISVNGVEYKFMAEN